MTLPKTIEQVTEVMLGDNRTLIEAARNAVIENEGHLSTGIDLLKSIKERVNAIETERKTWVNPLNEQVKRINAKFKTLSEPLEDARIGLNRKVLDCQRKIEDEKRKVAEEDRQRREAELLKAAEEKEALGNTEGAEKLLDYATKVVAKVEETGRGGFTGAKSTVRKTWTYEVTDIKALANARPDLVMVDSGAMRDAIRNELRECAGVRIYQEKSLSIR